MYEELSNIDKVKQVLGDVSEYYIYEIYRKIILFSLCTG